ncbi:riboflavin synthase subunit alpha [Vreelandella populi]|uniref:Riboflavin synthase n=1 Tax=Vreelandella populi TaxID=2498858 RepID=A0A3S0WQP0_9GAMM|nr:riboflavin synthase subunit alpha [Halomonas populi]RUR40713.1 riboflavin synthase subunit alpha [Halomonas populi]RUR49219.1 riboflavin synthase subunit alpha [Halomonas populi]RUR55710.1 riboflavin synthase subunit alpha [Halomonas populi]
MFTGIVQGTAKVVEVHELEEFRTHVVALPPAMREGLEIGASVAHNGVCLTVTTIDGDNVSFDLMRETLRLTNLGAIMVGERVNIERAARFGDEIGGHSMSGHIICMAKVVAIEEAPNNRRLWFSLPDTIGRFVFEKGYIGVDGISLTVGEVRRAADDSGIEFSVNLIPETLSRTILNERAPGDDVNIEIDPQTQVIVETVERVLAKRL